MGNSQAQQIPKPAYSKMGLLFGQLCQKGRFTSPVDKKIIKLVSESNLKGKKYLITGASSGIGLQMCKLLLEQGASLVMVSRSQERLQKAQNQIVSEIKEKNPNFQESEVDVKLMTLDLASIDQVKQFSKQLLEEQLELDGFVNNGGALPLHQVMRKYDNERQEIEETLATHVISPYILCKQVYPLLEKRNGIIINNSSAGAYGQKLELLLMQRNFVDCLHRKMDNKKYHDGALVYAQCKRAMLEYTSELAKSIKTVKIISAHPGWAQTPGVDALFDEKPQYKSIKFREPLDAAYGMVVPIIKHAQNEKVEAGGFYFDGNNEKLHQPLAGTSVSQKETDEFIAWLDTFNN